MLEEQAGSPTVLPSQQPWTFPFLFYGSQSCTIGMVLRLWSDTKIHLDGDG